MMTEYFKGCSTVLWDLTDFGEQGENTLFIHLTTLVYRPPKRIVEHPEGQLCQSATKTRH